MAKKLVKIGEVWEEREIPDAGEAAAAVAATGGGGCLAVIILVILCAMIGGC